MIQCIRIILLSLRTWVARLGGKKVRRMGWVEREEGEWDGRTVREVGRKEVIIFWEVRRAIWVRVGSGWDQLTLEV